MRLVPGLRRRVDDRSRRLVRLVGRAGLARHCGAAERQVGELAVELDPDLDRILAVVVLELGELRFRLFEVLVGLDKTLHHLLRHALRLGVSDKRGAILNEDMIVVTGNAACSIAKRNAILAGVPKAVWRKAYDAVEKVIAGDAKTLVERRDMAMKAFAAFGVTPERVFLALGVAGLDEITLEHMPTLTGAHSALKNGEATVEELFPVAGKAPDGDRPRALSDRLDALAGNKPAGSDGNNKNSASDAVNTSKAEGGGREASSSTVNQSGTSATPPADAGQSSDGASPPVSSEGAQVTPQIAWEEGKAARDGGKNRKAVPAKFAEEDGLKEAYLAGFDGEDLPEREPGEEG